MFKLHPTGKNEALKESGESWYPNIRDRTLLTVWRIERAKSKGRGMVKAMPKKIEKGVEASRLVQKGWETGTTDWNQITAWHQAHLSQSPTDPWARTRECLFQPLSFGVIYRWQKVASMGIIVSVPVSKTVPKFKWVHIRCLGTVKWRTVSTHSMSHFYYWHVQLRGY